MKYVETKKRKLKLSKDLDKANFELTQLNKDLVKNEGLIIKKYRTVQDFSVDHTTTMLAITEMEAFKKANIGIVKQISNREKKIKEIESDLGKLKVLNYG